MKTSISELQKIAFAPYEEIESPTTEDWQKSYEALRELCRRKPKDNLYSHALGDLCYYGRHTGGEPRYEEAREWFQKGVELLNIESLFMLADMLAGGLGGEKNTDLAERLYLGLYRHCREEFEHGSVDFKFADAALRLGRVFHEGELVGKNDLEAMKYLLEAKYAIEWRKPCGHYGDDIVEKDILSLIDACDKPAESLRNSPVYAVNLQAVHQFLLTETCMMTIRHDALEDGFVRLEFRRKRRDGGKPDRILMSVASAMKCFMTDAVVLYANNIRRIWSIAPGETVTADEFRYDQETDTHSFLLNGKEQLVFQGGVYVLAMDEFWLTTLRGHPDRGSDIPQ